MEKSNGLLDVVLIGTAIVFSIYLIRKMQRDKLTSGMNNVPIASVPTPKTFELREVQPEMFPTDMLQVFDDNHPRNGTLSDNFKMYQ